LVKEDESAADFELPTTCAGTAGVPSMTRSLLRVPLVPCFFISRCEHDRGLLLDEDFSLLPRLKESYSVYPSECMHLCLSPSASTSFKMHRPLGFAFWKDATDLKSRHQTTKKPKSASRTRVRLYGASYSKDPRRKSFGRMTKRRHAGRGASLRWKMIARRAPVAAGWIAL
jgi:hypothetical protein